MNALEKILAKNSQAEVFFPGRSDSQPPGGTLAVAPPTNLAANPPLADLPELTPCPRCSGLIFWESTFRDGQLRCEACEPPPSRRMIGRRLMVGEDPAGSNGNTPASSDSASIAHPGGTAGPVEGTGGAGQVEPAQDSEEARRIRLGANWASGNCTGNDWADSRRRGRLADLVETVDRKRGQVAATGYTKFVNQRF